MPYCPYCGSETSNDDAFCRSCGAMLYGGPAPQRPPKGSANTKIIAFVIVGIILVSGLAGAIAILAMNAMSEDITRTYEWNYNGQDFKYSLTVKRSDYNRMMDSDIDRTGSVSTDRYIDENGRTVFAVSDYVVTDGYIKKVSADLATLYKERFGAEPTNSEYTKFAMMFVRLVTEYDYDEAEGGGEYWRYPLETLFEKLGDCEDTSILLAALLNARGIRAGVILAPSHAMCAVCSDQLAPDTYSNERYSEIHFDGYPSGVHYYAIETTVDQFWNIGDISDSMGVVYMHLYLGSTDDYYFKS